MFLSIWLHTIYSLFYRICVLENIVFNIHCVNPYSFQRWRYFFFEINNFWGFYLFYLLILYFQWLCLKATSNFKYAFTIEFYYCPNHSLNINNYNTHIAAIASLPLTMHPRSWAKLLTFGPKYTLPNWLILSMKCNLSIYHCTNPSFKQRRWF